MIKYLLQAIIVVFCLLILIPMMMLLVGEGALAGKIFSFFLPEQKERTEIVEPHDGKGVSVVHNDGKSISVVQQDVISSSNKATFNFLSLEVSPETVTGEMGRKE